MIEAEKLCHLVALQQAQAITTLHTEDVLAPFQIFFSLRSMYRKSRLVSFFKVEW